jgi:HEAT repeat protein
MRKDKRMMLLHIRKISACLVLAAFVAATASGCSLPRLPWKSNRLAIDAPPIDRVRIRQDAIIVLRQAAEDDVASTRFIALEAIPSALGQRGGAICKQALDDPSPEVRTIAAMGVGDLRYAKAKQKLQRMARFNVEGAERDARAYCATLYALHQLGDQTYTTELGTLLFDREKEVRTTAAAVMGKMKLRAAISPLKSALADELDHDMKFELTRALARCGDKSSLRRIEAHTRERFVDEQIIAVKAMIELQSPTSRTVFATLVNSDESPRVKVVAAGGLAAMGDETPAMFKYCVQAAVHPRRVMEAALGGRRKVSDMQVHFLQSLAVTSLGQFRDPQALNVVAKFIKSSDPSVRVASAACILKAIPQLSASKPIIKKKKMEPAPQARTKPVTKRPKLHTAGAKD